MADDCLTGFGNTGFYETCDSNFKVMRGAFILKMEDDDGDLNFIPFGTEIDQAYLDARVNDPDPSTRWYPVMNIEEAASTRAEPTVYTAGSGAKEIVKQGARDLSFEIRNRGAEYLGQIKACSCEALAFYAVDSDGKLRGKILDKTDPTPDLYPIKIQPNSFDSQLILATEDNPEHLLVTWQYGLTEKDELLRVYPSGKVSAALLDAKGLIDAFLTVTSVTTTSFTAKLTTLYSTNIAGVDKFNVSGLVAADFDLYNVTDAAPIVITSVTETSPGTYDFVIPTTPTAEVKRLTPDKLGFDFGLVVAKTFTV